jgi:phosphoglycolate phosphatase
MEYTNYIFDLDGTLLDTLGDLAASTNYALRQHGLPEHSIDEIRRFVGNGVRKLMERAIPNGKDHPDFDSIFATFQHHYLDHSLDTTAPYPGIIDMLKRLKTRGCKIAVVSNKFHEATSQLCRHFFNQLVDVAIGENEAEGIRKKPAPDSVRAAMKHLGATVQNTVYVGDSEVDVETAQNSGIPCISVLWGFRDQDFLRSHNATTFVHKPEEIV